MFGLIPGSRNPDPGHVGLICQQWCLTVEAWGVGVLSFNMTHLYAYIESLQTAMYIERSIV
jgi:hypothetical protein